VSVSCVIFFWSLPAQPVVRSSIVVPPTVCAWKFSCTQVLMSLEVPSRPPNSPLPADGHHGDLRSELQRRRAVGSDGRRRPSARRRLQMLP
jgi:hypothetical protein